MTRTPIFPLILFALLLSASQALLGASPTAPAPWEIAYGKGPGQVSFWNSKVNPRLEEASGLGPMAFRIRNGNLWVADSLAGRILEFGADGKFLRSVAVPTKPDNSLIEDFLPDFSRNGALSGFWVADGADQTVRKISPSGKVIVRLGGQGDTPGRFLQIHQIESGREGRLFVGDYGRSIVAAFDPTGKLLWELPWERSGFAVTPAGDLLTLSYSSPHGYFCQRYSYSGNLLKSVHLGHGFHQNPRLWSTGAGDSIRVSFVPPGGFKGILQLVTFGPSGAVQGKATLRPPSGMNRFLEATPDGEIFKAQADFDSAPSGQLTVAPFPHGGDL